MYLYSIVHSYQIIVTKNCDGLLSPRPDQTLVFPSKRGLLRADLVQGTDTWQLISQQVDPQVGIMLGMPSPQVV